MDATTQDPVTELESRAPIHITPSSSAEERTEVIGLVEAYMKAFGPAGIVTTIPFPYLNPESGNIIATRPLPFNWAMIPHEAVQRSDGQLLVHIESDSHVQILQAPGRFTRSGAKLYTFPKGTHERSGFVEVRESIARVRSDIDISTDRETCSNVSR